MLGQKGRATDSLDGEGRSFSIGRVFGEKGMESDSQDREGRGSILGVGMIETVGEEMFFEKIAQSQ